LFFVGFADNKLPAAVPEFSKSNESFSEEDGMKLWLFFYYSELRLSYVGRLLVFHQPDAI